MLTIRVPEYLLFLLLAQVKSRKANDPADFSVAELVFSALALAALAFAFVVRLAWVYPQLRRENRGAPAFQVFFLLSAKLLELFQYVWFIWLALWCLATRPLSILSDGLGVAAFFIIPGALYALYAVMLKLYVRQFRIENRAVELEKKGDLPAAITLLRDAITAKGPTPLRCGMLGALLSAQGHLEESLSWSDQAIELSGGNPDWQNNKAMALWKLQRTEEALDCLKEVNSRSPDFILGLCNRGQLLLEVDRQDEAVLMLRRAEKELADIGKRLGKIDPAGLDQVSRLRAKLHEKGVELG
jgi:tetratricopeptide (TPR) repeat protein